MRTATAFLLIAIAMAPLNGNARPTETQVTGFVDQIEATDYGLYRAEKSFIKRENAKQFENVVNNPDLIALTNTIPAQTGVNFGFHYRLVGQPFNARVRVDYVVIFPPEGVINPKSGVLHSISYPINVHIRVEDSFVGYSFDRPWEVVPGNWTMQLWVGGKKLAEHTFLVAAPLESKSAMLQSSTN